ncbi:MAG: DUF523 domain-containing protein [Actinomycetota bacterium]|nr:DUF523 domain-containing protein [Actinomycetota bacterium]
MDRQPVHIFPAPTNGPAAKILVSGCLNGPPIRYNQTNVAVESPVWDRWAAEGRLVPFCAELAAGMLIPRRPAEILGGDGTNVRSGTGTVVEDTGADITDQFVEGAQLAVAEAVRRGCVAAVLTDGSPSCGSTYIYDGSFSCATKAGTGVVAQMLIDNGIRVFSETELDVADEFIQHLES